MATNCQADLGSTRTAAHTAVAILVLVAVVGLRAPAIAQVTDGTSSSSNNQQAPLRDPSVTGSNAAAAPVPTTVPRITEKPIGAELDTLGTFNPTTPRPVFPKSITLNIASWHLGRSTDAPASASASSGASEATSSAAATTWRTTFGSERTTANWRRSGPAGFEADIIAMQGVTDLRSIRKSFGVRRFHLIASRQLLTRTTETSAGLTVLRSTAPPTTAVAYRRQRGVRIAGVRHFLPPRGVQPEPSAITAFRLRFYRKMIWIASLDVPADCTDDTGTIACEPHRTVLARFLNWSRRISRQKTPLVLLGSWPAHVTGELKTAGFETDPRHALQTPACAQSSIKVLIANPTENSPIERLTSPKAPADTTCVATAQLTLSLR